MISGHLMGKIHVMVPDQMVDIFGAIERARVIRYDDPNAYEIHTQLLIADRFRVLHHHRIDLFECTLPFHSPIKLNGQV